MNEKVAKGLLVVLSSPSGGGKTTVIKKILESAPPNYCYSISMTTRPKREGEQDGVDYFFVDDETFQNAIRHGDLIEFEKVHDWYYGTPKSRLLEQLAAGKVIFMDLDVYGALHIKREFDGRALLIFLKPPSIDELIRRLCSRSTESPAQIERRLERLPDELAKAEQFDAVIVNADLDETVSKVNALIKERLKHSSMEVCS